MQVFRIETQENSIIHFLLFNLKCNGSEGDGRIKKKLVRTSLATLGVYGLLLPIEFAHAETTDKLSILTKEVRLKPEYAKTYID